MKNYKLRYLRLFEDDLSEIVDYIAFQLNNPQAALDLTDAVEHSILERLHCPEGFEPYRSSKDREHLYYRIYVRNFTVYYVIIETSDPMIRIMEVRRILYNKRNRKEHIK